MILCDRIGEKIGVVWSVLCVFRFTKGRSGLDDLDLHKHCSGTAIVCTITLICWYFKCLK